MPSKPILRRQKAISDKKYHKKKNIRQQRKELKKKIIESKKELEAQILKIVKKQRSRELFILSSDNSNMRNRMGRCYITMEQIKQTYYYKNLPKDINKSKMNKVELCKIIQKHFHISRIL